tara:strand:- start:6108 stop:6821 length:714 start_codon:yes stop_codon:yes gene_type:complete
MNKRNYNDVICIIPARGGSKGLAKKNIAKLNGEPLISRPIKHAKKSGVIGTILVTTDDKKIAKVAKNYGALVPFLRPKKLSKDLTTTEDTLKHALLTYEKMINKKFNIAVFLTCTDIFRDHKWITKAVKILKKKPSVQSVFAGYKTHKNYWEKNKKGEWIRLKNWMAVYKSRQIRKSVVREDTGLSCASRAYLWRKGKRIGNKVEIIVHENDFSFIDIHSNQDLKLANLIFEKFKHE